MKNLKTLLIGTLIAAVLALSSFMPPGTSAPKAEATTPFYCYGNAYDNKQNGNPNYHWDAFADCAKSGSHFLVEELYTIVASQHFNWDTFRYDTVGVVGGNLCNNCGVVYAWGTANYAAQGGYNCWRINEFFHAEKDGNGYGNYVQSNQECY